MVGRATFCSILKLSFDLIRRHIVLYFLPKRPFLLPTNHKIRGLVGSQNGASIHWSVPISLQDPGSICIHRWLILFISVGSWNPRFTQGGPPVVPACPLTASHHSIPTSNTAQVSFSQQANRLKYPTFPHLATPRDPCTRSLESPPPPTPPPLPTRLPRGVLVDVLPTIVTPLEELAPALYQRPLHCTSRPLPCGPWSTPCQVHN